MQATGAQVVLGFHPFEMVRPNGVFSVLLFSLLFIPTLTWGQAATANEQPTVNLGAIATLAGDTVDIPLVLSAPGAMKIRTIVESISFPPKLVSLIKAGLGLAGEESQADIATKISEDSNSELSILEVTITSKSALKAGVVAYLKFKVSPDAKKDIITLKVLASKATAADGTPLALAKGKNGEIGVYNTTEEMPVTGCFFFNH